MLAGKQAGRIGVDLSVIFIALGLLFLAGLAADVLGRQTRLPRVTLLLLCGIVVGRSGLDLVPDAADGLFEFMATAALTMVALLLGGSFRRTNLARHGREILSVSLSIVVATVVIVGGCLAVAGLPPELALVLGAIACATDPASTQDAITQSGSRGRFAEKLKGIVAIDDAWGLIAFSLAVVLAHGMRGTTSGAVLADAVWEISGAILLGSAIGAPAAALTGRIRPGEPSQAEALGLVFLTAGLALWLDVSFLIAAMVVGAVIVNFARHHTRPFHQIESIQWPFLILFFFLAGSSLHLAGLWDIGMIGGAYLLLRALARIAGGWAGARLGGAPRHERIWFGPALMPQAGVAVGMALVAGNEFPQFADTILTLTIGATVVFELVGPVMTLVAVRRVDASAGSDPGGR